MLTGSVAHSESVISCGGCYACKRGCNNGKWRSFSLARTRVPPDARTDLRKPAACSKLGFVGLSGNGGGLAEYFSSPEEYLHHLPDNVSLKTGAFSSRYQYEGHESLMTDQLRRYRRHVRAAGGRDPCCAPSWVPEGHDCARPRRWSDRHLHHQSPHRPRRFVSRCSQ